MYFMFSAFIYVKTTVILKVYLNYLNFLLSLEQKLEDQKLMIERKDFFIKEKTNVNAEVSYKKRLYDFEKAK